MGRKKRKQLRKQKSVKGLSETKFKELCWEIAKHLKCKTKRMPCGARYGYCDVCDYSEHERQNWEGDFSNACQRR